MHRGMALAALLFMTACADTPTRPPTAAVAPTASDYEALAAWFAERDIILPAKPPPAPPAPLAPAAKAAQDGRILGDGDRDGDNDFWDVWYLWNHLTDAYTFSWYDLDAMDINRSGLPDWIDLGLLGNHLYGVPTPPNPYGIGQPMTVPITASLSPNPDAVSFAADGTDWKRFTVQVTGGSSVVVMVNGLTADTASLEIFKGSSAPGNFCPAERNDSKTVGDGDVIWISGCSQGNSSIFIQEQGGNVLFSDVWVPVEAYTTDATFDIDLVFVDNGFTSAQKTLARQAAARWEAVITEDLPDHEIDFDSASDSWKAFWDAWSGMRGRPRIQDQETVDDVRIYLGKQDPDIPSHASGGAFWNRKPADGDLPVLGVITFSAAALSAVYEFDFEGTMLHEIGHVLGIGTLWYYLDFLGDPQGDPHFKGMMAIDAFNRAGGWDYRDNKVPVQVSGGHWRGSVFGDELMTGARSWPDQRPLSEITLQALADMGYQVDITRADPYTLPQEAVGKPAAGGEVWCKVLRPPPGAGQ